MIDPPVIKRLQALADKHKLKVDEVDNERPWGGEFIFANDQVTAFQKAFFPKLDINHYQSRLATPKFLVVAPGKRFSWQYHKRRGELWSIVEGPVGLLTSYTDIQPAVKRIGIGEVIETKPLERHRLAGLDTWGVVAELWLHADAKNPSKEDDNVRVEDDYGRQ